MSEEKKTMVHSQSTLDLFEDLKQETKDGHYEHKPEVSHERTKSDIIKEGLSPRATHEMTFLVDEAFEKEEKEKQ